MNTEWKKLQNGTDVRGVAIEGVVNEKVNLTEDVVKKIAASFAVWLSYIKNKPTKDLKIGVSMDSRLSGPKLKECAIKGIEAKECHVYDCGRASTPAMFMTTVLEGYKFDGSIMITASHLPFNRNGLKFFTENGGLTSKDIKEILCIAEKEEFDFNFDFTNENIKLDKVDFVSEYSKGIIEKIKKGINSKVNYEKPLKGFKIVVDAGNGVGGFFKEKILDELGADTKGSQFLDPDGRFPNHIPNPEDKEAMMSIRKAVLDSKADLGIIFDTDVDRAAIVDSRGDIINRNRLIALCSAIILEEHPKSTIVTDSVTSNGLKKFIEEKLGGIHHRFKRGYKNVIDEAIRLNNEEQESYIAIESSGHAALKENYFLDDGAYLVSKVIVKMAKMKIEENKDLHELIKDLEEPIESFEYRLKICTEEFKDYGTKLLEDLKSFAAKVEGWHIVPNNYEGVRVSCDKDMGDGWFLLRISLHDPVMPLNIESDSKGGSEIIKNKLINFLEGYDKLDMSKIK